MTDIQFDEEQQYRHPLESRPKSIFVKFVLSTGVVTAEKDAQYVLVGFAVLMLALAFLIPILFGSSSARTPQGATDAAAPAPNPR
jgi:hypothetical protein